MKQKILIIGGGLTGLTAAHRLAKTDAADVTVVERSDTVGGLASGFSLGGFPLEKTYHHIFRTDRDIIQLVDELGLTSKLEWHDSSMAVFAKGKAHAFGGPKDVLRFSPLSFFARLRLGFTVLFLQKYKNWRKLAPHSAKSWMRRVAGNEAADVIWDPLLRGKFSGLAGDVSMAWLWARIHIRANSRDPSEGREKLGYFNGGFQLVSDVLSARAAASGARVQTNTEVSSLVRDGARWRVTLNGLTESFDQVLFTGSSTSFARLLEANRLGDETYRTSLRSLRYLGAACLIFSTDQEIGDAYWTNINEPEAPFLVFINHTQLVPRERYGNRRVYYIGAYLEHQHPNFVAQEDVLIHDWFGYLKKLFPQFKPESVAETKVFRFKDAQHVVDATYEQRIPDYQTPIPGLWLANFSQIFPEDRGTNYAVREGEKLARLLAPTPSSTS